MNTVSASLAPSPVLVSAEAQKDGKKYANREQKMTGWFPVNVKPLHVGVYEAQNQFLGGGGSKGFAYWDGKNWGNVRETIRDVIEWRDRYGADDYGCQSKKWRGLAEKAA